MTRIRQARELKERLGAAFEWMESLGVDPGERFAQCARSLEFLESLRTMSPEGLRAADISDEFQKALVGRFEASDLIRIHGAYGGATQDADALRGVLKKAVHGPLPGEEETPDQSGPRNWLAELGWGAVLQGSGFNTRIMDDFDVLQFEDVGPAGEVGVTWEVKRPQSIKKLAANCSKAGRQVSAAVGGKLNSNGKNIDFGCTVLVLDSVLPPPPIAYSGAPPSEILAVMKQVIEAWAEVHREHLEKGWAPKNAGIRLWWRCLVRVDIPGTGVRWSEFHQPYFFELHEGDDEWWLQLARRWSAEARAVDPGDPDFGER